MSQASAAANFFSSALDFGFAAGLSARDPPVDLGSILVASCCKARNCVLVYISDSGRDQADFRRPADWF
jgi:hypothetical protein